MIRDLTPQEKAEIQALTDSYAASVKAHPTKGKHDFGGSLNSLGVGVSEGVNFSADIADAGNPSGIYQADDFSDFNSKAKQEIAFQSLRRIVAVSNVRESVKTYLTQRNDVIKRNKAKKAEKEKQAKDKFVSHPSWY